jgi:hypothetical protein
LRAGSRYPNIRLAVGAPAQTSSQFDEASQQTTTIDGQQASDANRTGLPLPPDVEDRAGGIRRVIAFALQAAVDARPLFSDEAPTPDDAVA